MDQRFRKVPHRMKGHVPDAASASNLRNPLPGFVRDRDVENCEPKHLVRMGASVRICDWSAPIVPYQQYLVEAEFADELADVASNRLLVVTGGRTRGIAQASHIGSDHRVALRESRDYTAPFVPGLRPSMEQYQRVAAPGGYVMKGDTFERH